MKLDWITCEGVMGAVWNMEICRHLWNFVLDFYYYFYLDKLLNRGLFFIYSFTHKAKGMPGGHILHCTIFMYFLVSLFCYLPLLIGHLLCTSRVFKGNVVVFVLRLTSFFIVVKIVGSSLARNVSHKKLETIALF